MADLASDPGHKADTSNNSDGGRPRGSTTHTPRWVKMFGIVIVVVFLLFVVLHLTGYGFGGHMHMSRIENGEQQLSS